MISHLVLTFGLLLAALGGFGHFYYEKKEQDAKDKAAESTISILESKLNKVQSNTAKIDLIYQNTKPIEEKWTEVELKNVPDAVADYVLLLFSSNKGRILGKARVKGTNDIYSFSTTSNNTTPVAIRNL